MNEDAAFLEAIAENPDELGPRLRYADYLDESLDPASVTRAEFIRVQCALDHLPESDPSFIDLIRRERELLNANWRIWMRPICQALGEPLPVPQLQRSWGEWMRRRFRNVNQSRVPRLELSWTDGGPRPKHHITRSRPPQHNPFLRFARFARGFVTKVSLVARPSNNSTYLDRLFERTPVSDLHLVDFDRCAMQHLVKRWLRRLRKLDLSVLTSDLLIDLIDAPDAAFIRSFELFGMPDEANFSVLLLSEAKTLQPEEIGFRHRVMTGNDMRALADSLFVARAKRLILNEVSFEEPALVYLLEQTSIERLDLLGLAAVQLEQQFGSRLRERFPRLKLRAGAFLRDL
jgi:uncharacterized protein (TIGR02996 family)